MRRTIFMALLAALLLVPAAAHAAADPIEILRDCQEDDVLQGDYTVAELRKARSELPTDIDEYSPCRDVLSRAISAKTSSSGTGGSTGGGGGTGGGGVTSAGGGTGTGTPSTGAATGGTGSAPAPDAIVVPETAEDTAAVLKAAKVGGEPVQIDGRAVSPGASRLAAHVGRNDLPTTQIALIALLLAGSLAGVAVRLIRARGLPGRQT